MQKRLLGTLAAFSAAAGVAAGQAPPQPIGQVGGYADPVPPGIGGPGGPAFGPAGPGMPGMPVGMPGMMPPGMPGMMPPGMPGVGPGQFGVPGAGLDPAMGGGPALPPGLHGDQTWTSPPPFGGVLGSRAGARSWLNIDYTLSFASAQPAGFPFVTTSAPNDRGLLGRPTTTILHSRTDLGYDLFSGFRVSGGRFFSDDCRWGVSASGFATEQKSNIFQTSSDRTGQPLLARPFINAITGNQDVLLISFPTFAAGSVVVDSSSQTFGADLMGMTNLYRSCPSDGCAQNVNLHAGFRFTQLSEDLSVGQRSTIIAGTAPFDGKSYSAPAIIEVRDRILAINDFYGGQIGLSSERRSGRFLFSVFGKVAAGIMHQRVDIDGSSALVDTTRNIQSRVTGGLFANASNIGRYNNDEFAFIPEVNASLGYNWTSWLSTTVGYNFMYMSRVARPGSQFSPVVNPTIVPTSPNYGFGTAVATPNPILNQDDFWLQGVNFGLNMRY